MIHPCLCSHQQMMSDCSVIHKQKMYLAAEDIREAASSKE